MAGPLYAAESADRLRAIELDGLWLLFHAPSGTTHIVAPPVPQILDALRRGPAGPAALVERIAETHAIEEEGAVPLVEARLRELEAAGLVTRL